MGARFGHYALVTEQAVLVHITSLGSPDAGLDEIDDPLIEAIDATGVGEFDGNEIGPDGAMLYMYAPDADRLWEVVEPVVRSASLGSGSYAVKRHGEPGASETCVDLA
jgi:hypothetical protein